MASTLTTVVLLDEVEKTRHEVIDVFTPVFDEGYLLDAYMRTFGEIESVWVPWGAGDKRSFGFITFQESTAAAMVVKASPHAMGGSEVILCSA